MSAATPIEETTSAQRLAADPSLSAFVSANAGSGKTRVLTNRVARLLLGEVDPSTILCITFTKAAAAEMADRLFRLLGEWALAEDVKLQAALAALDGGGQARDKAELARARRLFARALETPGGLKIQTIHSFCESVLKRFPLEAGVAPGFAVIEDIEAGELRRRSVERVAAKAEGAIAEALAHLLSRMTGSDLKSLLENSMAARRRFARADEVGWSGLAAETAVALGVEGDEDSVWLSLARKIEAFDLASLSRLMRAGPPTTQKAAEKVDAFFAAAGARNRFDAIRDVFLTAKSERRSDVISKKIAAAEPAFAASIRKLQDDILAGLDAVRGAQALKDTTALLVVLDACFSVYAEMKARRAALDFDDLIAATRGLFGSDGAALWVLYKLDMGLTHILLDEAQDTGPDAWDVIEAPLAEFFSGAGARGEGRTFFAVGDQKQSIYSFQGADAALFNEKEADLGKKIGAVQRYENVSLMASFRTTAPVLDFVDALFAPDEVIENVSNARPLKHHCTRAGAAGLVEIWPLAPQTPPGTPDPWDVPLDATPADSPPKKLAAEVAATIAGWLRDGTPLESQGRPIAPGDIMILVQARSALFTEMIRALGAAGVPVAGADKVKLTDDQGVLDLISYARAVLFAGDDLSLAEVLKSPFFGVGEESLFDLAAGRAPARLWDALAARRDERPEWRRAFDEIDAARAVAQGEGAVAFFAHILECGAPSGWRRIAGRLGPSAREPIEELLRQAHDFEASHPRSLRLFIDAVLASDAEVSRESSEAGPTVRVMTAHKAKGLEANIVFLLDAHRRPPSNKSALVMIEGPHGDRIPALAIGDAKDQGVIAGARERAKRLARDEYRRLLYVAATRARDRLYICGHELGNDKNPSSKPLGEKSWHALAEDAFDRLADRAVDGADLFGGRARRLSTPQSAPPEGDRDAAAAPVFDGAVPSCLLHTAPAERRDGRLSPSQFAGGEDAPAYSPVRGADPYRRGRVLHRLLELLPDVAADRRRASADRILRSHAGAFSEAARAAMREEAMRVLEDPAFAAAFAPGSRAEVSIGGRPAFAGGALVAGQIDRLAVTESRVLVVDYKTNRPPPSQVEDAPRAYIAQMAAYRALLQEIYPGRKIETALLWTFDARLMPIPDEALDQALNLAPDGARPVTPA